MTTTLDIAETHLENDEQELLASLHAKYGLLVGKELRHVFVQGRVADLKAAQISQTDLLPVNLDSHRKTSTVKLPNGQYDHHVYLKKTMFISNLKSIAFDMTNAFDLSSFAAFPAALISKTPESIWMAAIYSIADHLPSVVVERRTYIRLSADDWLETNDPEVWDAADPSHPELAGALSQLVHEGKRASSLFAVRASRFETDIFTVSLSAAQWLFENNYQKHETSAGE